MTKAKNLEEMLRAPFSASDLEWRIGRTIKGDRAVMLPYVTARGIQNRLDDVFGVAGWSASYEVVPDYGVICTITCDAGGKEVKKSDGSGFTQVESLKGAISGALKRAAVQLGIGRYLYNLPDVVVNVSNKRFYGTITLPDEFLPENERMGNSDVKVSYKKSYGAESKGATKESVGSGENHVSKGELTPDVEKALDFVVQHDKYNEGKKLRDVWDKSIVFLANGKGEQAEAAKLVARYKGLL